METASKSPSISISAQATDNLRGTQLDSIEVWNILDGEAFQIIQQRQRCASLEPEVVGLFVVEALQKTEWSIHVLTVVAEVIAVILLLQQAVCSFRAYPDVLCKLFYARSEHGVELFLCDAAKS